MIRVFYISNSELKWEKLSSAELNVDINSIVWVDLETPNDDEVNFIETKFNIELFSPQEAAEIESSSRYFETEDGFEANTVFLIQEDQSYALRQVSTILKGDILFTLRNANLRSFADTVRKLKIKKDVTRGFQFWLNIIETQIDLDADIIEYLSRSTNVISKKLIKENAKEESYLLQITELQENTILIRESLFDKQRLVTSLTKSDIVVGNEVERLRVIIKDINSLLQHTQFSFERLEYLQNTFLGLVNIEQNKVIKIFTVVTVIFMPPTLIASIYGMNFDFMPELNWRAGYPFALLTMVISSLSFLWYFKRKKWL